MDIRGGKWTSGWVPVGRLWRGNLVFGVGSGHSGRVTGWGGSGPSARPGARRTGVRPGAGCGSVSGTAGTCVRHTSATTTGASGGAVPGRTRRRPARRPTGADGHVGSPSLGRRRRAGVCAPSSSGTSLSAPYWVGTRGAGAWAWTLPSLCGNRTDRGRLHKK